MNTISRSFLLAAAGTALLLADFAPSPGPGFTLVRDASAFIGRPLTPMSYAGVARRTTRRVVYTETAVATSAAAATTAAAASAAAAATAPAPAPAPAPATGGGPPIGSTVAVLPSGCVSEAKGGVEYFHCGGVYYRPGFQGNNLIYMVVPQP